MVKLDNTHVLFGCFLLESIGVMTYRNIEHQRKPDARKMYLRHICPPWETCQVVTWGSSLEGRDFWEKRAESRLSETGFCRATMLNLREKKLKRHFYGGHQELVFY